MSQAQAAFTDARLDALTDADFEILAWLADAIWRAHYSKIISHDQIAYMLADRYAPEKLRAYLNADDRWLMLLRIDNKAVGYCSYALTDNSLELKHAEMKPPKMISRKMKLEQLYLLPELHGKGLGKLMLHHVEEQTRARGCRTLVLQVNKRNDVAITFYRKAGFAVHEEAVFNIGGGFVMDDYIMEKML